MLADVVPSERTFNVGGREWKVAMQGFLAFHAELEIYIFDEMSERLAIMAKHAPKDVSEKWYNQAYDQCKQGIQLYEAAMWTTSTRGFARAFWIAIRKTHPDVTLEDLVKFLYPLPSTELAVARDAIEFAKGIETNPSQGAGQTPPEEVDELTRVNSSIP